MKSKTKKGLSRRRFLGLSALGLSGLTILPGYSINGKRIPPSDRVVLGYIGLGRQGINDFRSFTGVPGVQVAACCDVDSMKNERFRDRVIDWKRGADLPLRCDTYEHYGRMLERTDLDAVVIGTPDHWHALQTIHACQEGKDVFVQKPLAFTIREGFEMVRAVRDNKRILQVGSQQRSQDYFIKAIDMVRSGAIGHITHIHARVGDPPTPFNLPEHKVPDNLNFNLWMGPLNDPAIHYHPDICPPISLKPSRNETLWGAWRWYRETGNGFTADWGAHMFDIAQAAIGMDGSGPTRVIPKGYRGQQYLTYIYQNGIILTESPYRDDNPEAKGIRFEGTGGWISVSRSSLTCSDPSLIPSGGRGRRRSGDGSHEVSAPHMQDFIDSVRSRRDPVAPVEVGCSTNTMCNLGNIATELGRPVEWNPATLRFIDDEEATNHRLTHYQYRNPYRI
jgi:predicted dehydrogenase